MTTTGSPSSAPSTPQPRENISTGQIQTQTHPMQGSGQRLGGASEGQNDAPALSPDEMRRRALAAAEKRFMAGSST
jgi:hypothetical protein